MHRTRNAPSVSGDFGLLAAMRIASNKMSDSLARSFSLAPFDAIAEHSDARTATALGFAGWTGFRNGKTGSCAGSCGIGSGSGVAGFFGEIGRGSIMNSGFMMISK